MILTSAQSRALYEIAPSGSMSGERAFAGGVIASFGGRRWLIDVNGRVTILEAVA